MESELATLLLAAASLGLVHTLLGPDHYLPFVLLGRARGWGLGKTLAATAACGAGHVGASLLLGLVGVAAGLALGRVEAVQATRGSLAAWLLIGFGLAYAAWGLRRGLRRRPHTHWHRHADGSVHRHRHDHLDEHAHPHLAGEGGPAAAERSRRWAPWALFAVFVVGPCEPLVPLLMVPAARGAWREAALLVAVFAGATLVTMVAAVVVASVGLGFLRGRLPSLAPWARFGHALTGLLVAAWGVALFAGL